MNEPLLERISQLERSVKRWRVISLLLALLLIGVLAVGGIYIAIPPTQEPGGMWLMLPWVRARAAREAELRARQEAAEAERRAARQREKPAEDEAPNNKAP